MKRLARIVRAATQHAASDAHISGNSPLVLRVNGVLYSQQQVQFTHDELDDIVESMLTSSQLELLRERKSLDFSVVIEKVNIRANLVSTSKALVLSLRFLPGRVPSIEELNLHPLIGEISELREGLVLVCGPTGSGKTSTIAAMINHINNTKATHIVTLEDPIEYRYPTRLSVVDQRELHTHFDTYEQGLEDVLRQMPDVIMVGELRNKAVINHVINIAESGHLVIGTMHAHNVETAVYRLLNAFPMEAQPLICSQLSTVLKAVIIQRLESIGGKAFRVPCLSVLRSNRAVQNTIRENKVNQIESFLDVASEEGMYTFDRYRSEFLAKIDKFIPPASLFDLDDTDEVKPYKTSRLLQDDHAPSARGSLPAAGADQPRLAAQKPKKPGITAKNQEEPSDISLGSVNVYSLEEQGDYKEFLKSLGQEDSDS